MIARLVRILNAQGGDWSDPIKGADDVDGYSTHRQDAAQMLQMQVVRASNDEHMWARLSRDGVVKLEFDADRAADELMAAVVKKSKRYPAAQKSSLILLLDAGRTPGHTFHRVFNSFSSLHLEACRACGFGQVWAVGALDQLVFRLDA